MFAFILGSASLTSQMINAAGTALIYSLWLGMICALLTGLLLAATRNVSAAIRYNLLTATLFLFATGVGLVFILQLQKEYYTATADPLGTLAAHTGNIVPSGPQSIDAMAIPARLMSYLDVHSTTVVFIWFLDICFKSAYMGIGLRRLYRMKRTQIRAAGLYWQEMLARLSGQLQIGRAIDLMDSGLARVPMVIGFLKPVILIPIGLFTTLSQEEAEAILLHELAHIRRRDFLVSLFQNVLEILFFFNPAVLWLSYLIRREREHCCDDLVLAQTDCKIGYIRALLNCQAYQPGSSAYAITLFSDKKQLVRRVKRMTRKTDLVINRLEKALLAFCLIGVVCCTVAFSGLSAAGNTGTGATPRLIYYHTPDGRTGVINLDTLTGKSKVGQDDADEAILRKLATDLTTEKLITGLAGLDGLKLNDTVFQVNGLTLPEALRSKYKTKYLPQAGYGIYYGNVHFSGRGTFIIIPKLI